MDREYVFTYEATSKTVPNYYHRLVYRYYIILQNSNRHQ